MCSAFFVVTTSVGVPGIRNCSIVGDTGPAVTALRGITAASDRARTKTARFTGSASSRPEGLHYSPSP